MKTKVKNTWDECKTKKEQDAFIKDLDRIDKTSKFISFNDFLVELLNKGHITKKDFKRWTKEG